MAKNFSDTELQAAIKLYLKRADAADILSTRGLSLKEIRHRIALNEKPIQTLERNNPMLARAARKAARTLAHERMKTAKKALVQALPKSGLRNSRADFNTLAEYDAAGKKFRDADQGVRAIRGIGRLQERARKDARAMLKLA